MGVAADAAAAARKAPNRDMSQAEESAPRQIVPEGPLRRSGSSALG